MRRIVSPFLTAALAVWLMPLGAFIRPSQEQTACGGRRGMHMCSMMSGKVNPSASSKVSISSDSSVERTAKSSASGGNDFVADYALSNGQPGRNLNKSLEQFFYPQFSFEIPEPPPRGAF